MISKLFSRTQTPKEMNARAKKALTFLIELKLRCTVHAIERSLYSKNDFTI